MRNFHYGRLFFARESGEAEVGLRHLEASYFLSSIYTYYERERHEQALELITSLHARFPSSTFLHFELIELLFEMGRYPQVEAEALRLEAKAGTRSYDEVQRQAAGVWRARAALYQGEPERAWAALDELEPPVPGASVWLVAWVELARSG